MFVFFYSNKAAFLSLSLSCLSLAFGSCLLHSQSWHVQYEEVFVIPVVEGFYKIQQVSSILRLLFLQIWDSGQQSKQRYPGLSLPSHPMQFLGRAHHIILKPDKSCSLSSLGRLYSFFHDQLVLHHHRPVQHCTNPSVHFLLHCPDQCFGCFHSPTVWLFHWESYSKNIIRGLKETLTALLSAVLCANTVHSTKPHTHTLILLTVLQTHWLWH